MNKIYQLEELCGEYYKYVYNEMVTEQPEDIEEWLEETFKFAAVNDTDTYEFYNWYEEMISNLSGIARQVYFFIEIQPV